MSQDVKPRKIWRIILFVSLAVNLLMLGVIGGSFLRGGGGPPRGFELQLGPLSEALTREDRRKIGDQIRREVGRPGLSRNQRRAAFEGMINVVEAQPFDPAALTQLIEDQQDRTDTVRGAALTAFVAHISAMTADERQEFAQNLRDRLQRNRDGGKRSAPSGG